jgi:hypothetical protein
LIPPTITAILADINPCITYTTFSESPQHLESKPRG